MKENNRDSLQRLQKTVDWLATGRVANQNSELHVVKHSSGKGYKNDLENYLVLYFKTFILMRWHICLIYRVDNIENTVLYGVMMIVVDNLAKSDPES